MGLSLRRVGSAIAQFFYANTAFVRGEFTGAVGSISLVKFKGLMSATWNSTGLVTFTLLANDGVSALKGLHIKNLQIVPLTPTGATVGGWTWSLAANNMGTAGTFQIQFQQQSWAAADVVGIVKVAVELSSEAPSA